MNNNAICVTVLETYIIPILFNFQRSTDLEAEVRDERYSSSLPTSSIEDNIRAKRMDEAIGDDSAMAISTTGDTTIKRPEIKRKKSERDC